jgi:hypothetical protein
MLTTVCSSRLLLQQQVCFNITGLCVYGSIENDTDIVFSLLSTLWYHKLHERYGVWSKKGHFIWCDVLHWVPEWMAGLRDCWVTTEHGFQCHYPKDTFLTVGQYQIINKSCVTWTLQLLHHTVGESVLQCAYIAWSIAESYPQGDISPWNHSCAEFELSDCSSFEFWG